MKFKNYLGLFILTVTLLVSCSKAVENNTIIDESKFVDVLVDIHIADATLIVSGLKINADSTKIGLYYNDVLIKHKVTQKQIQNTFAYYSGNPKKFEKIYELVSEKVVKREEEYNKSIENKE
jgi:hypothetical protein